MSDLRDLLDSEARRVDRDHDALTSVMRRVERRRKTRRAATATLALMIAAAGAFGAFRAFSPRANDTRIGLVGSSEVFEGIWPETGPKELSDAQQSIDDGHQPWRADPVETSRAFATNVMQWRHDQVMAEILGSDDPTAVLVQLFNRDGPNVDADLTTLVTLKQLGRKGEQGIWSVVSAEGGLLRISAPGPESALEPGAPLQIAGELAYGPEATFSVEAGLFAGEGGILFDSEGSVAVRRFEVNNYAFVGDLGQVPDDPDGSVILLALARDPTGNIIGAAAMRVTITRQATQGFDPGVQLPPAVAAKHDAIAEAAADRNHEAIRRLINPDNFTFSYGGGRDPIAFWKELEKQGEDPLHTLGVLMTFPFGLDESGIYVWPSFFLSDPTKLTEEELRLARTFATQEEIDSWRQFGLYFGYRVGIEPSGEWIFFVAGD